MKTKLFLYSAVIAITLIGMAVSQTSNYTAVTVNGSSFIRNNIGNGSPGNGTINGPYLVWKGWEGTGYYLFAALNLETSQSVTSVCQLNTYTIAAYNKPLGRPYTRLQLSACLSGGTNSTLASITVNGSAFLKNGIGNGSPDNGTMTGPYLVWQGWKGPGYYLFAADNLEIPQIVNSICVLNTYNMALYGGSATIYGSTPNETSGCSSTPPTNGTSHQIVPINNTTIMVNGTYFIKNGMGNGSPDTGTKSAPYLVWQGWKGTGYYLFAGPGLEIPQTVNSICVLNTYNMVLYGGSATIYGSTPNETSGCSPMTSNNSTTTTIPITTNTTVLVNGSYFIKNKIGNGSPDAGTFSAPYLVWQGWQGSGYYLFSAPGLEIPYQVNSICVLNTFNKVLYGQSATIYGSTPSETSGCSSTPPNNSTTTTISTTTIPITTNATVLVNGSYFIKNNIGNGSPNTGTFSAPYLVWQGWKGPGYYLFAGPGLEIPYSVNSICVLSTFNKVLYGQSATIYGSTSGEMGGCSSVSTTASTTITTTASAPTNNSIVTVNGSSFIRNNIGNGSGDTGTFGAPYLAWQGWKGAGYYLFSTPGLEILYSVNSICVLSIYNKALYGENSTVYGSTPNETSGC